MSNEMNNYDKDVDVRYKERGERTMKPTRREDIGPGVAALCGEMEDE